MTYNIKILKTTPFDVEGTILSIRDFRAKYGWICTTSTTNEELVKYIKEWKNYRKLKYYQEHVGEWFEIIEEIELPLCFIYEDIFYSKEFDGVYYEWTSPSHYELWKSSTREENREDHKWIKSFSISDVRNLIKNAKFTQEILHIGNNMNKKM